MISFFEANIDALSVHRVGNKTMDEYYVLSESSLDVNNEDLNRLLLHYFLNPFNKVSEVYRFFHPYGLVNNVLQLHISKIFGDNAGFHEGSEHIARHLYDVTNHPKIRSGELYVAYFKNVQIEGELLDCIGIFKSETKETYLKVNPDQSGFHLSYEPEAININQLDKGCLIFNTDEAKGYKVVVLDNSRVNDAIYWKDEFLQLQVRNDSFTQTRNALAMVKSYVTERIDDEFDLSKADKIELLNRSIEYFKQKETFDFDEFSSEVIGNEEGAASFKKYKSIYDEDFDAQLPDSFEISTAAVKKAASGYKSTLKLDRNFTLYIHGKRELVERGFDEDKNLNYYKVYFNSES